MIFARLCIVILVVHEIAGSIYKPAFPDDVFTGPDLQIESKVLSNGFGLWTLTTTPGNRIKLVCEMTQELNCSTEAIMVSPEGEPDLMGALTYCSVGQFVKVISKQHLMTVGFITLDTPGYRSEKFYCRKTKAIPIENQLCNCGNQEAGEAMMAALYQKTVHKTQGMLFNMICASTIIDNRHVLTTALCVQDYVQDETGVEYLLIILGPHYSRYHIDNYVIVEAVIIHEKFPTYDTKYTDIQKFHPYNVALVRSKTFIEFDNAVSPACLPYKFSSIDWTSIPENDIYLRLFHNYSIPHFFNVEIVNELECSWHREVTTGTGLSDSTRQLCNFIKLKDEDIFYDNFASGGPIMYKESTTGLQYVIGIVTQVEFTQKTNLLLNVKLAPLLTWITTNTKIPGNDYLYCKL